MAHPLSVGIVSQSAIADDPRVRRQGDALHRAGWNVVAIGLEGAKSAPPAWRIVTQGDARHLDSAPTMPVTGYASRGARGLMVKALDRIARFSSPTLTDYERTLLSVRADRRRAETIYWTMNSTFWDLLTLGQRETVDLWLGNDWTSLPIVARLARAGGVPYVYDAHELAAEEFNESGRWRWLQRPIRIATEGEFIKGASVVTAVSDGIAARLQSIHKLERRPLTIRSTPSYVPVAFRPTGKRIRVLYHGAVWEHRGLETCIRSVAQWGPQFDFTIRGPVSDAYRNALQTEINAAGVQSRVQLVGPVPMTDLVREAAAYDIGLFALPGHSIHNRFALPNKFFEYMMAGLALCMSELPEMSRLMQQFDTGITFKEVTDHAIATAINSLTVDKIDAFKQRSLAAAKLLCWEHEQRNMIDNYKYIATTAH